jgi:hypothetical protein
MKNLLLLGGFFLAVPITILIALIFLLFTFYSNSPAHKKEITTLKNMPVYAALPNTHESMELTVNSVDSKEIALQLFLEKHDSPLQDHTDKLMDIAEKYSLDYRLIPAIGMQETNLCKKARENSHNCWGYNVTGGNYKYFEDFDEAIETVAYTLAIHYRDKRGLTTPDEIMKVYTPSSNGSWAESVNFFMSKLPNPNK